MSTPAERLEAIVANAVPSKVKFRAQLRDDRLQLVPVTIEPFKLLPSEDKLQALVLDQLQEAFDHKNARYTARGNVQDIYRSIKQTIVGQYQHYSARCNATKRKTESFIYGIGLNDQNFANYLISMFIEIRSLAWDNKTHEQKRLYFEPLESLRRVYGKQR